MSVPSLPFFAQASATTRTLTQNSTHKSTPTNGRGLTASTSNSTARLNSVTSNTTSSICPNKSRQKAKAQPRLKAHHVNPTDSRSKARAKTDSRLKGSSLRMRLKRDVLDALDTSAVSVIRDPLLDSDRDEDPECVDDDTEDDETEGEPETDRDPETGSDKNIDAEASRRPLSVDPFSAEEERIITVLSRKLEQLREFETTSTMSPPALSPIETSSPTVPLPPSLPARHRSIEPLPVALIPAVKASDDRGRLGGDASAPSQKQVSTATLNGHSLTSSVGSSFYASSPSPTPSSPSSVYAAATASPISHRNGFSANTTARTNSMAKSNGHAVPIAVNGSTSNGHAKGKGTHHDVGSGVASIEFNGSRTQSGAHVSTLSSPEMSLSASPHEPYDTRWIRPKVNPKGITFGAANGNTSFSSNNVNGKARVESSQAQNYVRESEGQPSQTRLMVHALMKENEELKSRIAEMEGDYMRLAGLNEAYREELIGYRRRLGLSVDSLIGLASDSLPPSTSPSVYTHTQGPHTYHHYPPSSPLGNFNHSHPFHSYTSYNNINGTNGNNAYQYHHSYHVSPASPSNSNLPASTSNGRYRRENSYAPGSGDYAPNGFGYENGLGVAGNNGFGITSTSNGASSRTNSAIPPTSTNGVPIPRPPSQVHANRPPKMAMPMSVPTTDASLLHMHGSMSRGVNETQTLSTSASSVPSPTYPSPPYFANSPSFFSPPYSSSYSASSAASSSATSSASASTNVTSPPSSLSFTMMMMLPPTLGVPSRGLSYPLVPPPSLSSSLGSGGGGEGTSGNLSPVDQPSAGSSAVVSRRESNAGMSVGRRGSVSTGVVGSVGAGGVRRSRGGSLNHGSVGRISRHGTVDES